MRAAPWRVIWFRRDMSPGFNRSAGEGRALASLRRLSPRRGLKPPGAELFISAWAMTRCGQVVTEALPHLAVERSSLTHHDLRQDRARDVRAGRGGAAFPRRKKFRGQGGSGELQTQRHCWGRGRGAGARAICAHGLLKSVTTWALVFRATDILVQKVAIAGVVHGWRAGIRPEGGFAPTPL